MSIKIILRDGLGASTLYDSIAGQGNALTQLTLSQKVNTADRLEFTMPPSEYGYDKLDIYDAVNGAVPLRSVVELYNNDKLTFRGRLYQVKEGLYRQRAAMCEGELAFFNDTIIDAGVISGEPRSLFADIIRRHNSVADVFKRFTIGTVSVTTDAADPMIELSEATTTMAALAELIKRYGGYITFSGTALARSVNWSSADDFGASEQPVKLGLNMLDIELSINPADYANRLYAYGKKLDNGQRTALPPPYYIEDLAAQSRFGVISKATIYNDVEDAAELMRRAEADLAAAATVVRSVSAAAIDLSRTADESTLEHYQGSWDVGKTVHIISPPHGIDGRFMLTSRTVDYLNAQNDRFTLGAVPITLTGG